MNNFIRVLPYFWPHRRQFFLSVGFAVLVAVFWGLNLSMSFLIVKVFLQNQSLHEYVETEITKARRDGDEYAAKLKQHERDLRRLDALPPAGEEPRRVELLKDQARHQSKLSEASRKLHLYNWLRSYALPWVPRDKFDVFALILGVFLAATLLKGLFTFIQEVLIGSVIELTTMGLRKHCFRSILRQDYQTLALSGTPELMSRFTYDMHVLAHGLRLLGGKVIREPLKALTCLLLAFVVSWQLTLLSLLFAP
ncbi:MAG TPA: ABC transporter transmembrane domain-containing protein, partial [Planctomycetaceae bacterium]|nr:ABC transporter transmembrane domain-containing protein [Planctomycetaceae bacterium]